MILGFAVVLQGEKMFEVVVIAGGSKLFEVEVVVQEEEMFEVVAIVEEEDMFEVAVILEGQQIFEVVVAVEGFLANKNYFLQNLDDLPKFLVLEDPKFLVLRVLVGFRQIFLEKQHLHYFFYSQQKE